MQDINPFLGYLIHEMINFVYILMFNSVENYDYGITSQKIYECQMYWIQKLQFEIEQNATS